MGKKSAAVDAYIAGAAPFARPLLKRIRAAFHAGCPEVVEAIKWGVPHFDHHGIMGSMAAFKAHVSWGFWKATLMKDPKGLLDAVGESTSMGGMKVATLDALPSDAVLVAYVREAAKLNAAGVKVERAPAKRRDPKSVKVPADFLAAMKKSKAALATYEGFSWSNRNEYVSWIVEAKQPATRSKRIAEAVAWLAEGKPRHWKYMKERP